MRKRAHGDERQYGHSDQRGSGLAHERGPGYSDRLLMGPGHSGKSQGCSLHGRVSGEKRKSYALGNT